MEIRLLTAADDLYAVSRVYEESWRCAYRGLVPQDYLDAIPRGHWVPLLKRPGRISLVAVEVGEIVGTASVCPSRFPQYAGCGEVQSLYLLPEAMGKGCGRALLNAALQELAGRGFREVILWVLEGNCHARRFYERAGFAPAGETLADTIGERPVRELCYRYVLPAEVE